MLNMAAEGQKKLRVLCLHGFNNHAESFTFMTRGFREQFGSQLEFHIMDAPYVLDPEITPPEDALVEKGF